MMMTSPFPPYREEATFLARWKEVQAQVGTGNARELAVDNDRNRDGGKPSLLALNDVGEGVEDAFFEALAADPDTSHPCESRWREFRHFRIRPKPVARCCRWCRGSSTRSDALCCRSRRRSFLRKGDRCSVDAVGFLAVYVPRKAGLSLNLKEDAVDEHAEVGGGSGAGGALKLQGFEGLSHGSGGVEIDLQRALDHACLLAREREQGLLGLLIRYQSGDILRDVFLGFLGCCQPVANEHQGGCC